MGFRIELRSHHSNYFEITNPPHIQLPTNNLFKIIPHLISHMNHFPTQSIIQLVHYREITELQT